jgi:hypothetical protein
MDIEADTTGLFRLGQIEPPASVAAISEACLGTRPRRVAGAGRARLVREGLAWQVEVSAALCEHTPALARWCVAHELAHWFYLIERYDEQDLEQRCDALGASLVAPRALVLASVQELGPDPIRIAHALGTTQCVALLRLAELGVIDGAAVLGQRRIVARGRLIQWPDTDTFRRAVHDGDAGVRVIEITDAMGKKGVIVSG